jgi:CheY-like chemotaxis protein
MPDIFEARDKVPKMLIADDDPAIVRLLADRCVKMGFKVETASNGLQLLIKARRNHPDIVIVDVNMPELDGLSVCSRLLDPGGKPLEVVVVTGSNDTETAERCESLGMFYGRKGPDFWHSVEGALMEIYPDLAGKIGAMGSEAIDAQVPQRPRVLIVDDDPDVETFLASRLGKHGVETLYAPDATHG